MRVPMITRTVKTTAAEVLCVNIEDGTTSVKEFILPRTYKDDKAILRALEEQNADNVKLVHVVSTTVNERLYGMPEADFIKVAAIIEKPTKSENGYSDTDSHK